MRFLRVCALLCAVRRVASLRKPAAPASSSLEDRLRPLEGSCYAFVSAGEYWGYEWCHKRWVKQFQAAWAVQLGERRQETTLGTFSASLSGARAKQNASEHVFADGERCAGARAGAASTKRRAAVRFACCADAPAAGAGRNVFVAAVAEPATCSYLCRCRH